MAETEDRGQRSRCYLDLFIAALPQQIKEENASLEGVDYVLWPTRHHVSGRRQQRVGQGGDCVPSALLAGAAFNEESFVVVMNLSVHKFAEARFPIAARSSPHGVRFGSERERHRDRR
jgi:hypothetical protein